MTRITSFIWIYDSSLSYHIFRFNLAHLFSTYLVLKGPFQSGDSIEFDSYMIPDTDLQTGELRLLDVDNRMVVPIDTHIRLIVTGSDVIHSFAMPSLGLKLDCIPGRLNQASVLLEREGVFYGQCSDFQNFNFNRGNSFDKNYKFFSKLFFKYLFSAPFN